MSSAIFIVFSLVLTFLFQSLPIVWRQKIFNWIRSLFFDWWSWSLLKLIYALLAAIFQVTNQMVTACKNYLTDRGVNRVWDQPRQPMIEKLKACLRLNQEYQKCFQRTKKRIAEDPTMRPFEFSEMYIFGKFDAFCKRLNQVGPALVTFQWRTFGWNRPREEEWNPRRFF